MKKLLSIMLAGIMIFSVTACGGATTTAEEKEPLVEQTLFEGVILQVPKSIADTQTVANGQVQYFPDGKDAGTENIAFNIIMADYSGESDIYFEPDNWEQTFDRILNGLLNNIIQNYNGTLIEKGDQTLNSKSPIEAKYFKAELSAEDGEYNSEYFLVPDVNNKRVYVFAMMCYTDFDNIYADVWEDMLNSITLTGKVVPATEAPSSSNEKGVRPEFKEMMDSYEAFFDEYVAFMERYNNASTNDLVGMMSDMSTYMTKYAETMEKLNAIDESELSMEEAAYYTKVSARILDKTSKVMENLT